MGRGKDGLDLQRQAAALMEGNVGPEITGPQPGTATWFQPLQRPEDPHGPGLGPQSLGACQYQGLGTVGLGSDSCGPICALA